MVSTYNDGSANAPAGTPLLPTLLAGYAAIPPWQVPGVNYAVGVPTGTTLLNPASISIAGVSINAASHTITVTGNNVTLNGYDFSLGGGWGISIASGTTNTVIENSNFLVGSNNSVPVNAGSGVGNLTVQDDTFNGGGGTSGAVWAMVNYNGSGTFVAKYDSFLNTPSDAIDFSSGTMTTIVEYNVFENLGTSPGAHADTVQYDGVKSNNSVIAFNTVTSGEEGIQLCAQGSGSTLTNTTIDNNVIVAKGPSVTISYSIAVQEASGDTINGVVVDDNYIDLTGSYGAFYPPAGTNLTYSGNVNMKTGAQLASPSGTSSTDVSSVTASPASGTEALGSAITISLHMDEAEFVTGTPTLALNDGGTATYVSGSGSTTLVFSYTVASTNTAVSALAITGVTLPTGASITDPYGNAANLAGAVATFTGLGISPGTSSTPSPTAAADSAVTPENQAVTIAVLANDSGGGGTINPASVAVSTAAAHGTTAVNATTGAITYTPATGYFGTDTFQYTVADTDGVASAPATVTVTVDSPPTAVAASAVTPENQAVTIAVLANDTDPVGTINPASVAVSTAAAHGTTAVNATTGVITYTPATGYFGTDTFQYTVANTLGIASTPATVTVTVEAPIAPPTAAADSAVTPENQAVSIAVLANDTGGGGTINPASVAVSTAAAHGTTAVNATTGAITYTPTTGYYGTDTFQYTVADTDGESSTPATVTVTVEAPPTAAADSAVTPENQPVTIAVLANDTDANGTINPDSVAVSTAAAHGTTAVNATTGAITYTPASGYYGTDTFQYTVANTLGGVSAPATVTVTVDQSIASSGYADGSSGAPAGTPQLPTILSGYAVRPPWEVAGVDYAVGVPTGTTLLNPATIAMAGVSVNTTNHTVTVTGNNVTLNGYDFSLANGYEVIVEGANDTIENSNFVVGPNQGSNGTVLDVTSSASNFSLIGNNINGNNIAVTPQVGQTVSISSSGALTIQYNYLHNSGGDMIDLNASTAPQVDIIQYNLFENIGVNTAHSDTIQWYDTQTGAGSDIGFNTVYENIDQPGPGNGALVPLAEGPTATMAGLTVNNDTIIQTAADANANFSTGFETDSGGVASDIVIHDLYIDPTGPLGYTGSPWFPTGYYGDNLAHPTALSNVIDMVTGAQVPVPSASTKTSQGYYTYADASGYSPSLSDVYSITPSQASGTLSQGNTVTFTVNTDENFTVTGTPTLTLNDGGTATYSGGSATNALTFTYTVGASNTAVSALAVTAVNLPGGATVKDSVGNAANLAGALATFAGLGVNPGSSTPPVGQVYMLSTEPDTVIGGNGPNTVVAASNTLLAGDVIEAGSSGANTLVAQGAGTFDLSAPTTLSNIQTADVEGTGAGQTQFVYLRTGLDLTLNVLDNANVMLIGAANNDIINLGAANAIVYLGGPGETVVGGTGNDMFCVTAATIGATIEGGTGTNSLLVQSGGTVTMGSNITNVSQVTLTNSPVYDFTANATAGLTILAGTGSDTIAVGAASQTVVGSTGTLTVQATATKAGVNVETGSGGATLDVTTGGTATLNSGDTNLTVQLNASTNLGLGGLGFITAIGSAAGNDTITAGGTNQTLESISGSDTLVGSGTFGDTFLGTSAGLSGDTIQGFGGSDAIDITDMISGSVQPYVFNAAKDQLMVTDGTHSVTLTFAGSYTVNSFAAPVSDGHTGTLIKFA